jgi:hypothetical protein
LLGIMALEKQDWIAAEALLVQALEKARASKYPWAIASALHNLAHLQHLRGNHQRSLELFLENLQISLNERDIGRSPSPSRRWPRSSWRWGKPPRLPGSLARPAAWPRG